MSAPRLTNDQKAEIVRQYREGVALVVIAERFGIHKSYPSRLADRRGVAPRSQGKRATRKRDAAQRGAG